jgi:hypothetical protein
MRKTLIALIGTIVLVATACGGGESVSENLAERLIEDQLEDEGGGDVDINFDDDGDGSFSIDVEGEDGGSFSFGGGDIPDELTIPIPTGGNVLTTMVTDGDVLVTLTYPTSEFDSVVAFYQDWTDGESEEFQKSTSTFNSADDVTIRTAAFFSSDSSTTINVTDCPSSEDDTYNVCLSVVQSP